MIFIDSNVPMYLVGAPHPHKRDARQVLEGLIADSVRLVTDAEVFQEILHRYAAINRRDAIQPAFDALLGVVDQVYPVHLDDVERAKIILFGHHAISSRHALHLAVMERYDVSTIFSFDRGFDAYPGVSRFS
jgi:predicted nucleic acid-binding protein